MVGIEPVFALQDLDLETDRLRKRLEDLQEVRELERCRVAVAELEANLASIRERQQELAEAERALFTEVEIVAAKARDVEGTLYSGKVKVPKELEALQTDLEMLRRRQRELEDNELEQLEAIEGIEGELADCETRRSDNLARAEGLEEEVLRERAEIHAELERIKSAREEAALRLPDAVLAVYDRLRGDRRLAGRVVTRLAEGVCGGCRIRLPILEYNRIRSEPPDAPVSCPGCGRLLVR